MANPVSIKKLLKEESKKPVLQFLRQLEQGKHEVQWLPEYKVEHLQCIYNYSMKWRIGNDFRLHPFSSL
jgi:hypothetical protein